MRFWLILVALGVAVPALAQNATIRDRSGNPLYKLDQRGDRTYRLDNAGNPKGYSRELPNGNVEYRTNAGDLIRTETPHH